MSLSQKGHMLFKEATQNISFGSKMEDLKKI